MPEAHGIGRWYWHRIRLRPDSPRHHRWPTQEYEWPYRWANSHTFRLVGRFGIVTGWWRGGGLDEESAEYEAHLNDAVQGRTLTSNERFQEISQEITYEVRS